MKLTGIFELENGVTIVNPTLTIKEIKETSQVGVAFVNVELSVANARVATSFIYHYEELDETKAFEWALNQIQTYKISE